MSFSSDQPLLANQLPISLELPKLETPELFLEQTELLFKRYANVVNTKEGAFYPVLKETATFQTYVTSFLPSGLPNNRNTYRMVVDFGALPNTTTKSVAHGIAFDPNFTLTRMYGASTDPVNLLYLPLPYASPTSANAIEMYADATNVVIITGSNRSAFTRTTVVLEYSKIPP